MAAIAVVAHSRKSLGGGLPELREIPAWEGVTDPLWYEVSKSRRAPKYARRATAKGSRLSPRFGQKVRYELDGGARPASKNLRIKVRPGSVTVCVPSGRRE